MAVPVFQISVPANGGSDVAKNAIVTATFDVALDPASITPQTVVLRNSRTQQTVIGQVSLSTDGRTITFLPNAHMWANSAHVMTLVGTDISTTCIKSALADDLAVSTIISFQTNDELDSTSTVPDSGEGEFPDDIGYVAASPLRLTRVTPRHNAFGIRVNTDQLVLNFSADLDPATVTGNIVVEQEAFYSEEDLRAAETDIGAGERNYFRCETGLLTGLDPNLFADRDYALEVVGPKVNVNFQTGVQFAKNLTLMVTLAAEIADTSGNVIGEDLVWFGCTEPYPSWVSLMGIRHLVGFEIAGEVDDDFVGLRIWQQTIDFAHDLNWRVNMLHPPRAFIQWVRNKAALDIWDDLISSKALAAGTVKELGDLRIQVNTAAGGARPTKMRRLEKELDALKLSVYGYLSQTPRVGIKSINDVWEPGRGYFRDRLWRAEVMMNRSAATPAVVANSMLDRDQSSAIRYGYAVAIGRRGADHITCA